MKSDERLLIFSYGDLTDIQLARVLDMIRSLPSAEGEERTWSEAEIVREIEGER
jgi:hypothetical protein